MIVCGAELEGSGWALSEALGFELRRSEPRISVRDRQTERGKWSFTESRWGRAPWRRLVETKGRRRHFVTFGPGRRREHRAEPKMLLGFGVQGFSYLFPLKEV